tara:strand:+ start:2203 stop:4032 length:1830 start_codon:yes stop_codon:yes gene_type:complete
MVDEAISLGRTIQFGFRHFIDREASTGRGWYKKFYAEDYQFTRPKTAGSDGEITVGGKSPKTTREDTFRMDALKLSAPAVEDDTDYTKKLLFSWAIVMDPAATVEIVGGQLRRYEKPDAASHRTAALDPGQQQSKYFWSRLQGAAGTAATRKSAWSKTTSPVPDFSPFGSISQRLGSLYWRAAEDPLKIAANRKGRDGLTSFLARFNKIIEVGGKSWDSSEELALRVLPDLIAKYNEGALSGIPSADVRKIFVELIDSSKARPGRGGSMVDFPARMVAELEPIISLLKDAHSDDLNTILQRVKEGGLELTQQHGRMTQMYGSLDTKNAQTYLDKRVAQLQKDFYGKFVGGESPYEAPSATRKTRAKTVAVQAAHPQRIGPRGGGFSTWTQPVSGDGWGGVAIFAVYVPPASQIEKPENILIASGYLPGIENIWKGVYAKAGYSNVLSRVYAATDALYSKPIIAGGRNVLAMRNLGMQVAKAGVMKGSLLTKIGVTVPPDNRDLATTIYGWVKEAALFLEDSITLRDDASFTDWVREMQKLGEDASWDVHKKLSVGWKPWLAEYGQPHQPAGIAPYTAIEDEWPGLVHPRPFLWMTAVGQAEGSKATQYK